MLTHVRLVFDSICHSPKGWTDQELGSYWLETDFNPITANKLESDDEYRLLILDGHNSHTTYRFLSFAEQHKIIVICLPPHTTHRLQPCDVGLFGPLSSSWKSEVNVASRGLMEIRKNNILYHYSKARDRAFKETTVLSAFRKCGIEPLNPDAIEPDAFAPALNSTTQAAQPIPTTIPTFVTVTPTVTPSPSTVITTSATTPTPSPIPVAADEAEGTALSANSTATSSSSTIDENSQFILHLPPNLGPHATREALHAQNNELRWLLDQARYQMQKDYALKKLMDKENEELRDRLYNKKNKPGKKEKTGFARHMTAEENLAELAKDEWAAVMKQIFKDPIFKERRVQCDKACKEVLEAEKAREKEAMRAEKKAEREREAQRKQSEKLRVQTAKRLERERVRAGKEVARQEKAAAAAAAKAAKARKVVKRPGRRAAQIRDEESEELSDLDSPDDQDIAEQPSPIPPPNRPRPRPRPITRPIQASAAPPDNVLSVGASNASGVGAGDQEVVVTTLAADPVQNVRQGGFVGDGEGAEEVRRSTRRKTRAVHRG